MKSFGAVAAALGVGFLCGGLAWPFLAGRLLQILIAALALSWVGARLYGAGLPMEMTTDSYSPFQANRPERTPASLPSAVERWAKQLRAADDDEASRRFTIPAQARQIISAEASRRLAEHHALSLTDPADVARARALVGDATWALIRPGAESGHGAVQADPLPLTYLDRILDDLESL